MLVCYIYSKDLHDGIHNETSLANGLKANWKIAPTAPYSDRLKFSSTLSGEFRTDFILMSSYNSGIFISKIRLEGLFNWTDFSPSSLTGFYTKFDIHKNMFARIGFKLILKYEIPWPFPDIPWPDFNSLGLEYQCMKPKENTHIETFARQ